MNLFIAVRRRAASLQYMRDPSKPASWANNDANNSLDAYEVHEGSGNTPPIWSCQAQTVANCQGLVDGMLLGSTIAPGTFHLKAFVDPRAFWGRIHGICNARTLDGRVIGPDCVTRPGEDRWLNHDWQKRKPSLAGQDTRVAWSGGCIVIPDADLAALGRLFDSRGILPGDLVPGILIMED